MKTATQAYKSQMAKLLRNHSYVGIAFGNIDVSAGSDGAWTGTVNSWSNNQTIDFPHVYTSTVVTLERNRWTLNGTQVILPTTNVNDGIVANKLSNSSGTISYAQTRDFEFAHALSGLTITFDTVTGEYPTKLTVKFVDEDGNAHTETVSPTCVTVEVPYVCETTKQVVITFTKMIPNRRPRIRTTLWGIGYSYSNADLVSCSQSNDVDPLSRRLPQEKFSFTILDYEHKFDPDNPSGVYSTINRGAPISVSYGYELDNGTIEWLASDTYNLDNKPIFKNSKVTFTGTGLLATMTNNYYRGQLGQTSFYDLAVDVLTDANLTPSAIGGHPWEVDTSLQTMYTTAPMPIVSHAVALQMIAHACNCRLYTDDQNIIHIEPFGVTPAGVFGGTFEDSGHAWISSWDSVDYGADQEATYVTLERNRWVLGTAQVVADERNLIPRGYVTDNDAPGLAFTRQPVDASAPDGAKATTWVEAVGEGITYQWWYKNEGQTSFSKSSIVSAKYTVTMGASRDNRQLYCQITDVYGNTMNSDIITLTIAPESQGTPSGNTDTLWSELPETATKRFDILHDVPRVVITFDQISGDYPDYFTVSFYDRDDTLLYSNVEHPTSTTHTINTTVEDCSYFTISNIKMKLPDRRARITKVAYFETDFALTLDSIKQDTIVTSKLDKLRNVTVAEYSYTAGDTTRTKLYEATTTETNLHIEYQMASDITISVTGGSVVSSNIYAQAADIVLSSGTKTIVVSGITINEGSVVHTYSYGSSGEDDIEENKLITNKAMADAHAEHVSTYLTLRNTYDSEYRGNPELEAGDIISLQTPYDNVVYGIVLVDSINFGGSLSGKLKVKGLA